MTMVISAITIASAAAAGFRSIWSMGVKVADIEHRLSDHDRALVDVATEIMHVKNNHRTEYTALLMRLERMVEEMTEVRLSVARIEARQDII
ncbi:hypothetical protein IL54_4403 [Sphingobium sp. ba1]|jgi:hypothetical protein|uniref:hypothetical protein n=1 Tax=Sphingobium sp. ba1 TaxID=1522072 RepID=UPI0005069D00|nr:hypothetical protein [Sphingobium sp. ba1]KFL48675.1 hypothetical protein IL54_4403 [Sphingobium sp. ba1]